MNSSTPNAHYDVSQGDPIAAPSNVSQVVVVGRSSEGVHMVLTEAASEALAAIISRWDTVHRSLTTSAGEPISDYDSELWNHVAIDLLAAKMLNLHGADASLVYATRHAPAGKRLQVVADIGQLADEVRGTLDGRARRGGKLL